MKVAKPTPAESAEQTALRRRFPKPTAAAAIYQGASILLSNVYLLYLVNTGQWSALSIVAFSVCELVVIGLMAHLALLPVPAASRMVGPDQGSIASRIGIWLFMLVWLGAVYGFGLFFATNHFDAVRHGGGIVDVVQNLRILTPLILSTALTVVAMFGDWSYWRSTGGLFVPQMAMSSSPKILTLVFAPLPAAIGLAPFIHSHPEFLAIVWSLVYLAIKALMELGTLAWQYFGMPMAATTRLRKDA